MILVVDDHPQICRALERLIQLAGMDAKCVMSAKEALEILEQSKPRAVLLDNQMPDMSGIDLLKIIRSRPDLQALPVVMFSAASDPEEMQEAKRLGAAEYFVKGQSDLDRVIERVRALSEQN